MARIGFTGTISVGKTTLVNALKQLPEFANYHFATERSKYLRDLGVPLNGNSTLKGQTIFLAERASELMYDNLITDRTIIDVTAFTYLANSIEHCQSYQFDRLASFMLPEYDYVFYVSPDGVEIEDNGVRTTDAEYRRLLDNKIRDVLFTHMNKITKYVELSGSVEERVQKVRQVVGI